MHLNETLASLRFSYLCHRLPGLKWIGKNMPRAWLFKWTQWGAGISIFLYAADRRRARHMRQAIAKHIAAEQIPGLIKKNLAHRKWVRNLVYAWPNWRGRYHEWVRFEGEENLAAALQGNGGAILLSGHAYGYSRMVAPVLAQRGYRVYRMGRGQRPDQASRWGGEIASIQWEYINYGENYWQHVSALQKIRKALRANGVIHFSVKGFSHGDPALEIDFFYGGFFLDPALLEIIGILQAPVLPCFAVCDEEGRLVVTIYPAMGSSRKEIMDGFGPLYSTYLKERPEFSQIWRRVVLKQDGW